MARRWGGILGAWLGLASGCGKTAVCCEQDDGSLLAFRMEGKNAECAEGKTIASKEIDTDDEKALGIQEEDRICGTICCVQGEERSLGGANDCFDAGGVARPEAECPPEVSDTSCRCDDPGLVFAVVSGCSGGAFADATQPSYCRSVVAYELGSNPDTHTFPSGSEIGFADCKVTVTCP